MAVKRTHRMVDVDFEKEFHNQIFKDPTSRINAVGKFYLLQNAIIEQFQKEILEFVKKESSVIEIGCGLDEILFSDLNGCQQRCAIDISDFAIEEQKTKAKKVDIKIDFFVMDAHQTNFKNESFNLVFGTGILHHLSLEKVIPELHRILKPNGKFIFIEPLGINPLIIYFRNKTPDLRTIDEKPLRIKDLKLIKSFFSSVKYSFFDLATLALPVLFGHKFNKRAIKIFRQFDHLIFSLVPFLKYYSWQVLIVATK